jgi:arginine decarboxylase
LAGREADFWERQKRAPLFEALEQHVGRHPHPFHVPGHKMGTSYDSHGRSRFQSLLPLDLTEISGLDDLHQPEGVIAEAQELAAEAFGAEWTRFLVGGSTAGNMALIMTVCKPGEKILVQRNCHKSVYNGIILARAVPVYIVPAVDLASGVAAGLRREDVERALHTHPDAKAVFLTNPTYYGMGIDLAKMAAAVHRFQIPLLVDEAHGAHYGFHPALPPSAMQCGADAAVQSTHKMGTSMTMSSMLHVQGTRIDRDRLRRILAMIQSSSPSYPLMASLDLARRHMVLEMKKELDRVLPLLNRLRERIASLDWLYLPGLAEKSVYSTLDPLKLLLCLRTKAFTGYQLQSMLEAADIYPELAESAHVLLAASTGTSPEDVEHVWQFLESVEAPPKLKSDASFPVGLLASSFLREQAMPMHEAFDAPKKTVPLTQAAGRISAEMVIPYPPGIPLLTPGERIDTEVLALLQELAESGARFHGIKDPELTMIETIA